MLSPPPPREFEFEFEFKPMHMPSVLGVPSSARPSAGPPKGPHYLRTMTTCAELSTSICTG